MLENSSQDQTPLKIKIKVTNEVKRNVFNKNVSMKDEYVEDDIYASDDEDKIVSKSKNKRGTRNKAKTRKVSTRSKIKKPEEDEMSLYGDEDAHTQAYYAATNMWKRLDEYFEEITPEDINFLSKDISENDSLYIIPKLGQNWRLQRRNHLNTSDYPRTFQQKLLAAIIEDASSSNFWSMQALNGGGPANNPHTPTSNNITDDKEELEFIENYIKESLKSIGLLDENSAQGSMDSGSQSDNEDDEICQELKTLQQKLKTIVEENRSMSNLIISQVDEVNQRRRKRKERRDVLLKEDAQNVQIVKNYLKNKRKRAKQ